MNSDTVIHAKNVSKDFEIEHSSTNTLKGHFTQLFQKKSKRTEIQHALKDISLDIKKGEFFGIVGRNGSGKSTLLKMLAGIYQPTKGDIKINGRLVPFIELGVGFNPELTGRENVYLNGALLNFSEQEVDDFYDEVVEFAELERFMDKKLKNYSSGMQVRLAFSMAVRAQADILLVDEVLAVGDADFQRKCFEYFKLLKKNKKTVVFVSHDMDAVREYCDRAVLIDKSKIVLEGKPEKISQAYTKLFNKTTTSFSAQNEDENRWGDQTLVTKSLAVEVSEKNIKIRQKIKANKDMDSFIVGMRIRNTADQHITGTNTKLENLDMGSIKKSETREIEWEVPNFLSDGEYLLDPAITHDDGITVSDWWDGAEKFIVSKGRKLPYPTDPGIKVKVKS
ncbi:MAG: ABC transporter ATP-binding protein [Candidatus Saccharibacteria bacterium]|nr:ABC transporter ATP-binding protein [Candidatus Saccharibacteria bacterium]